MVDKELKQRKVAIKIIFGFILLIILVVSGILIFRPEHSNFDYEHSKLIYPTQRYHPKYSMSLLEEQENYSTYRIVYDSKSFLDQKAEIHGLLYIPNINGPVPGILFLPGGGVTKENEPAAQAIVNLGYAVLVIDQRGIGETGGFYPSYDQDRLLFIEKHESVQHLGVYDAIKGLDTIRQIKGIDQNKLIVAGSSMGGRYALITAALYPNVKGAIIISSAGFHVENNSNPIVKADPYFLSLDPDRYIADISPRRIAFIHSTIDQTISIQDSAKTYALGLDPKSFYAVTNCSHGYCEEMLPYLKKELEKMTSDINDS
ncbi:MAG: alpha/beta hydrolase [Candidatus Nanoarchaeia archaeon]